MKEDEGQDSFLKYTLSCVFPFRPIEMYHYQIPSTETETDMYMVSRIGSHFPHSMMIQFLYMYKITLDKEICSEN